MRTFSATTTGELCCAPADPQGDASKGIQLLALPSAEAVARYAANAVLEAALGNPGRPLGLATGRTMVPVYAALAGFVRALPASRQDSLRRHWCSFNLDEYVGLGPETAGSFAAEMAHNLGGPLGLDPRQMHLPNGLAPDPAAEASRYAAALHRLGGAGLQLLGLGLNGHVGFNEPPCGPESRARCVTLCPTTRQANAGAFGGDPGQVPIQAMTLGMADILEAEHILLVVTGAAKAPILQRLIHSPPTPEVPASWLHHHPSVVVVADPEALRP